MTIMKYQCQDAMENIHHFLRVKGGSLPVPTFHAPMAVNMVKSNVRSSLRTTGSTTAIRPVNSGRPLTPLTLGIS